VWFSGITSCISDDSSIFTEQPEISRALGQLWRLCQETVGSDDIPIKGEFFSQLKK